MIKNTDGLSKQLVEAESNLIYDYLYQYASKQPPTTVIRKLETLLIQGRIDNIRVSKALEKIIFSSLGKQQFAQILSHCFYLILDCWIGVGDSLDYVRDLIAIIKAVDRASSYDRRRKQLIQLIKNYQQTSDYCRLQAVISIISPRAIDYDNSREIMAKEISDDGQELNLTDINQYLFRYPFLYNYFTPQTEDLEHLSQYIVELQNNRQQNFEIKLSKYLIYRFRLKQVAQIKLMSRGAGKIITRVSNPTLLSARAFQTALKQYLGKVDNNKTTLERSQRFIADNDGRNSYQVFKQDLYQFLIRNIKPRNDNYKFSHRLQTKLGEIFAQSNEKALNNTLILQTCRQLYSFLILDSANTQNSQKFANLIVNLGTAQVMIILTKLVLICPESKSDLEQKIALVTAHHQLDTIQDVPWLLKSLEHLQMALSIYFGNIDVPVTSTAARK